MTRVVQDAVALWEKGICAWNVGADALTVDYNADDIHLSLGLHCCHCLHM